MGRGLALFAVGPDGALGHMVHLPDSGWSKWSILCPQVRGAPSAFQNADGRIEVFASGPQGRLGHAWESHPGHWSDWADLGQPVLGDPCAFIDHTGRLQVSRPAPTVSSDGSVSSSRGGSRAGRIGRAPGT